MNQERGSQSRRPVMRVDTDVIAIESTFRTRKGASTQPHLGHPGHLGNSGHPGRVRRFPASLVAGALIALSFWWVNHGRDAAFNRGGLGEVGRFFAAALHPRHDTEFLRITARATAITLSYAVLGTVLSGLMAFVVGTVISTRWRTNRRRRLARTSLRWLLIPLRGIHEVLWALLLLNILGLDPLVAIAALVIPFGAITAKVFADQLDAVDPAPAKALRASGASETQVFYYAVLPTALPDLISYVFYRFECAIRSAAILGLIGAGGIGYELQLSFQSLAYKEMWTMLFALIAISGLADAASTRLRRRSVRKRGDDRRRNVRFPARIRRRGLRFPALTLNPTFRRGGLTTLVFVALGWSIATLNLHPSHLWSARTRTLFTELRRTWFPPDLSVMQLRKLSALAFDTATVSIASIAISLALAAPVAFVASRRAGTRLPRRFAGLMARFLLLLTRAIPPSVWAFLTVLVFFSGLLPAAVALGVYNFGVLGRLLAEVVENLDPVPAQVLRVTGARPTQVLAYAVVPVAASRFGSYSLYRWEVAARETIVVGIVAGGGLGNQLKQRMAAFDYPQVVSAVLFFIGLTFLVDLVSGSLRRRID